MPKTLDQTHSYVLGDEEIQNIISGKGGDAYVRIR
jgi:hypothetical protein